MNKFEEVSSDPVKGYSYHVTCLMMHLMLPTPPPTTPGQTDACENITFPQLIFKAVITPMET